MTKLEAMIDIETLGTGPKSIIVSIGLQKFNHNGLVDSPLFLPLEIDEQIRLGCDGTQGTLLWWMAPGMEKAREKNFCSERLRLPDAYGQMIRYLSSVEVFWANGPQFDYVILEYLMRMMGAPAPWKYNSLRDMRTLREEAGMPYDWVPTGWAGTAHDPVDDCLFQIMVVNEARRRLLPALEREALMEANNS